MSTLNLTPATTALVLIDLQTGIAALPVQPHSSPAVISNSAKLAQRFRELGATVVLVDVAFPIGPAALHPDTDTEAKLPAEAPVGWSDLAPELKQAASDVLITKRQWGAFYETGLDLQLRRRGIKTIVLAGIATNIGVESTARDAFERGFNQVIVEDACSALSDEMHQFAFKNIFPRMARIRSTEEVLQALA